MKIPNEIAQKVQDYVQALEKAKGIAEELEKWFASNGSDDILTSDYSIVSKPSGELQNNGEYREESGIGGCLTGIHYYPIDGDERYVSYRYYR